MPYSLGIGSCTAPSAPCRHGPSAAERGCIKLSGVKDVATNNRSSQGHNVALTGVLVPSLLDSGFPRAAQGQEVARRGRPQPRSRRHGTSAAGRGEINLKCFTVFSPESQNQNLVFTVLKVPYSLELGTSKVFRGKYICMDYATLDRACGFCFWFAPARHRHGVCREQMTQRIVLEHLLIRI